LERLAASPQIVNAIARHYGSDGVPPAAAGHLAAETVSHPDAVDTSIERFHQFFENYKSKGFDPEIAQHLAVESLESNQAPSQSRRFQLLHSED
jgi:hypothetical protein